jgi:serine/threonine protein kinase
LVNEKYQELYNLIHKLKSYNRSRTGTRGFIAPEIVFDINRNSIKSDIWSAGVLLFCMLYQQKSYYWESIDVEPKHNIIPLIYLYEYEKLEKFAEDNEIRISVPTYLKNKKVVLNNNINPKALDLLDKCLCLDYKKRINAKEALNHEWLLNIN